MMEDFAHTHHLTPDQAEQEALRHLQTIFEQHSMSCSNFNLPDILPTIDNHEPFNSGFDRIQEQQDAQKLMQTLNADQALFVNRILSDIQEISEGNNQTCCSYFVDGPGGSGKTMCYNTIISTCRSRGVNVASSAWTGIAATLLKDGRTIHNLFKLPVPVLDTSVCNVKPSSKHADYLRFVSLLIIDEASMIPANALAAIDKMLQDITSTNIPFGGKIFVLGGDFRQVLRVVPRKPPRVIIENCLKQSLLSVWNTFIIFHLTKNMRAGHEQQEFSKWLLQLGNDQLAANSDIPHSIELPPQCNIVHDNIVQVVFCDNLQNPQDLANTVILTPTNDHSLRINDSIVQKIPGTPNTYTSVDRAICDDPLEAQQYPLEFINSITPTGMPPHRLILKPGVIVMLLRNLDIRKGLCNGTRFTEIDHPAFSSRASNLHHRTLLHHDQQITRTNV
jgi:hypothetical protein